MSTEAISEEILIREFTRELHNKNAAVFAGAGLSMDSGYVDWHGLLSEIVRDLGLDPSMEHDLVTIAQYHCNQAGGNRGRLSQTILNHFGTTKRPTANHKILAQLPIHTYWTTNYDKLIERALEDARKVPDVKYTLKQLAVTRPDRNAVVYKMHGDIDHPADAVICKDDYEAYPFKMNAFISALRGELVEKTFLFVGFSFTDPNIDYVLSRVRVQYEGHQRHHYCIQRKVSKDASESDESFKRRQLKQEYFLRDLKRFGIFTVLVDEYRDITALLMAVFDRYKRSSMFISGAAEVYGSWAQQDATQFLHDLSYRLAEKNRIITGFGLGVGGAIINGVLARLNALGRSISDEHIIMRPFPQIATAGVTLKDQWTAYRQAMIDYAGIAIFVFGNKRDTAGSIVTSSGMREEFDLGVKAGLRVIPVGATGFLAADLWAEVWNNLDKYYPNADSDFRTKFQLIGDPAATPTDLLSAIEWLAHKLQGG